MTEPEPPSSPEDVPRPAPRWRRWGRRLARSAGVFLLALVASAMLAWAVLAIAFTNSGARGPRWMLAALFALVSVVASARARPRRNGPALFAALFLGVMFWFILVPEASNERDWATDVSRAPSAQLDGDRLTIRNLRDFDYRSASDFTPRWEDRTYDLSRLRGVDLILSYWGSKAIAHAIVSFGFEGEQYLAVSIETRREAFESYSALQGFFKQYELIYVLADERDVIRLRTNYRREQVYLYRTNLSPDEARQVLLSYLTRVNALSQRPEFYNALTVNCATSIVPHARAGRSSAHLSWEVLASGYAARHAYRNGNLDSSVPFETLQARSLINRAAEAADRAPDFSAQIRAGLPVPQSSARATGATGAARNWSRT